MDLRVCRGKDERRAVAQGCDIYAITAPIVVEVAERIIDGRYKVSGAVSAGETFDAEAFMKALAPEPLSVAIA